MEKPEKIRSFYSRKLIIIESLGENEYATGKYLYNRLVAVENDKDFKYEYVSVKNKQEYFNLLEKIYLDVNANIEVPMLHFALHGSKDQEGLILASGEFMAWRDLSEPLTKLNVACANNLFITLAACYGLFIAWAIDNGNYKRSVFWSILGREDEHNGEFVNDYHKFYSTLAETGSLGDAYKIINPPTGEKKYHIYNSEVVFKRALEAGWRRGFKKEIDRLSNRLILKLKRAGKPLPTTKAKMPQLVFKHVLDGILQWRDTYFMVDLYEENDKRFMSKKEVQKMVEGFFKKSYTDS
jgi:hypothetical protein